jgi:hypothetical protein
MVYRNKDANFFRKASLEKVRVYWENLKRSKKLVATTYSKGKKPKRS